MPYPDGLNTLGDHIRKKRLDLRLLQNEVAQTLGVDKCSVSNWETNRTQPRLHLIPRVVAFLGYDPLSDSGEDASLGERIVRARRARGIRQEDLARHLGVDPGTLAKWERRARELGSRYLILLEHLLELSAHGVIATLGNGSGGREASAR